MLYHVSETPGISTFMPRSPDPGAASLVWAISGARLHNYLLPRDCPRVTYYAIPTSSQADVDRFLGQSSAVIAVESAWSERIRNTMLHCYELPATSFTCIDEGAGYFTSEVEVSSTGVQVFTDPMQAILDRGVELRFLPNLQALGHAIAASTLQFSMIRMRNAQPINA